MHVKENNDFFMWVERGNNLDVVMVYLIKKISRTSHVKKTFIAHYKVIAHLLGARKQVVSRLRSIFNTCEKMRGISKNKAS